MVKDMTNMLQGINRCKNYNVFEMGQSGLTFVFQ